MPKMQKFHREQCTYEKTDGIIVDVIDFLYTNNNNNKKKS